WADRRPMMVPMVSSVAGSLASAAKNASGVVLLLSVTTSFGVICSERYLSTVPMAPETSVPVGVLLRDFMNTTAPITTTLSAINRLVDLFDMTLPPWTVGVILNCCRSYYRRPDGEVGEERKDSSASGRAGLYLTADVRPSKTVCPSCTNVRTTAWAAAGAPEETSVTTPSPICS